MSYYDQWTGQLCVQTRTVAPAYLSDERTFRLPERHPAAVFRFDFHFDAAGRRLRARLRSVAGTTSTPQSVTALLDGAGQPMERAATGVWGPVWWSYAGAPTVVDRPTLELLVDYGRPPDDAAAHQVVDPTRFAPQEIPKRCSTEFYRVFGASDARDVDGVADGRRAGRRPLSGGRRTCQRPLERPGRLQRRLRRPAASAGVVDLLPGRRSAQVGPPQGHRSTRNKFPTMSSRPSPVQSDGLTLLLPFDFSAERTVEVVGVRPAVFRHLIEFLYTGRVNHLQRRTTCEALLAAADRFQVNSSFF